VSIEEAIGRSEFFAQLGGGDLDALAGIALKRGFGADEMIFAEGEESGGFYLLDAGRVKIYKLSGSGREQILRIVEPGGIFGEAAVFSGSAYPAFARAIAKSEAVFFPAGEFRRMVESNPGLALNMLAAMAKHLRRFAALVEQLTLRDAKARLAEYLLNAPADSGGRVRLEITKRELASHLGAKPETLSRALGALQSQGVVSVSGSVIEITDAEKLEEVSRGAEK